MSSNGLDTVIGFGGLSDLDMIKNISARNTYVDIAEVTSVKNDGRRVDCTSATNFYNDTEVLAIGGSGIRLDILPSVGDIVLVLTPKTVVVDTSEFKDIPRQFKYDIAGAKCIPLGSVKNKSILSVKGDGNNAVIDNGTCKVTIGNTIKLQGTNGTLEVS